MGSLAADTCHPSLPRWCSPAQGARGGGEAGRSAVKKASGGSSSSSSSSSSSRVLSAAANQLPGLVLPNNQEVGRWSVGACHVDD